MSWGQFGWSVAVRGNSVAIGDNHYASGNKGAVFVYNVALSMTRNAVIHELQCNSNFGTSLAFTDDYDLLVGCPNGRAVFFYKRTETGEYAFQQKIEALDGNSTKFGTDIAVDGNNMIVGSHGRAHVFVLSNHEWMEVDEVIESPKGSPYFGQYVALSGNMLLISYDKNAYSYSLEDC
mmetsp:Transcript_26486/g.43413  ORF Transcript_26486/g.43413 Transcript_26486/m.43413 type:complete len:178 (+) Transcript_26486:1261-1794(+)